MKQQTEKQMVTGNPARRLPNGRFDKGNQSGIRWKTGQSGNPKGRPKGSRNRPAAQPVTPPLPPLLTEARQIVGDLINNLNKINPKDTSLVCKWATYLLWTTDGSQIEQSHVTMMRDMLTRYQQAYSGRT